jgi:predicted Zn-dependent protease
MTRLGKNVAHNKRAEILGPHYSEGSGQIPKNAAACRMAVMVKSAVLVCLLLTLALTVLTAGQTKGTNPIAKASALARAGRVKEAEAVLRAASTADPRSEALHTALGKLLFKQQKYEDAVQELGLALQINPNSLENSLLLSEALIGWQHFGVAVEFLQAVQDKFRSYAQFHYDFGLAYYSENKIKEAKAELEEAVRLAPTLDRAQYLLAACIATEGDYAAAVDIFRKLVKEHPNNAMYWSTLGQMLAEAGSDNLPEAVRACRRAQVLKPLDPHIQYVTATVLLKSGDFAGARPLFEHLVKLNPKELSPHVALARIYGRLGERELARKETQIVSQLEKERSVENVPVTPPVAADDQEPH